MNRGLAENQNGLGYPPISHRFASFSSAFQISRQAKLGFLSPLLTEACHRPHRDITARYRDPDLPAADVFAGWLTRTFFAP